MRSPEANFDPEYYANLLEAQECHDVESIRPRALALWEEDPYTASALVLGRRVVTREIADLVLFTADAQEAIMWLYFQRDTDWGNQVV